MTIRPGQNLIWAAVGLCGLSCLTFFWLGLVWLLLALLGMAGLLSLFDYRALKARLSQLDVSRSLPQVVGRDIAFDSEIRVANTGPSDVQGVLRDVHPAAAVPFFTTEPFAIASGETWSRCDPLSIPERGRHEFGPIWIRLRGPVGFLEMQNSFDHCATVKVLPEMYASKENLEKDHGALPQLLDKLTRAVSHGVGTEFESLAEYRVGDDPRRIDWRTTARLRRPMVRRYQVERHRDVMIVLDCGRLMSAGTDAGTKLDSAVDAGLLLARIALQSGDRCGCAIYDSQVRGYLPPVFGPAAVQGLAENVFDVQPRYTESDFATIFSALQRRQLRRSLIIVLSDIVDGATSRRFRESLARLAQRHLVLFAALRTPALSEIATASVSTLLDGSRKAVSFRLLRERERAIHDVRRSGVHILDVEPRELVVPLINRFIQLRASNLL